MEHIARAMYSLEVAELDMPHVVVTVVEGCPTATFSGPYPNGLTALTAAEAEHQADRAAGGTGDVTFCVAALYPAVDVDEFREPAIVVAEPDPGADCG
jgi:hypothetical protein